MSQRGYIPDEPAESEEEDELIHVANSDADETFEDDIADPDRSGTEPTNTSNNESEQSFVGKIRYNVSSVLSRMIRTAKDRFVASTRPRDSEYDHSETQPAKRRRLQEAEEVEGGFPPVRHASNVSSRVDRSCQTNQSDMALAAGNYGRANLNALPGSTSVTSVFARASTSSRGYGEPSVFRLPVSYPKQQVEPGGKRRRDEHEEEVEENEQEKEKEEANNSSQQVAIEPFDPFKFLAQIDKTPVDPKRRISGFLGNRCYQRRQEQLRRGVVGKYFFTSHQKPTKNLDTTSPNETDASSQRPSFGRGAYRAAASGQRIPPEFGGSPFYNGLTCYGGASAVNTLGTRYTASRSTMDRNNSVLIRKPLVSSCTSINSSSSASSTNVNATSAQESVTPGQSTTKQRMMEIWQEYDTTKNSASKVQKPVTDMNVRQELLQLAGRARPYAGTSSIPLMLKILREQKLASVANARTDAQIHPPTAPLIDVRPLYANQPIERREEISASSNEKQTTEANKTGTDGADPVLEEEVRDVVLAQKIIDPPITVVQQQQQPPKKTPSEPREDNVPKCDVTELSPSPSPSPSPSSVGNEIEDGEVSALTDDREDEPQRDATLQQTKTSSPISTPVPIEEDQLFVFADPIVMTACSDDQDTERWPGTAPLSIIFDEPELLQQDEQWAVRSFRELMAESASKWICDVCMVRNEPHQLACVACECAKPSDQKKHQEPQQPPPLPISTSSSTSSFATIVIAQSSRWECNACCVRNEPAAQVCVCCGTAKPDGRAEAVPEQPKKANDMTTKKTTTTMATVNPGTDSPFSSVSNLKDTFKSLLERQNSSAMWNKVYDLCQAPDAADEQSHDELHEQPQLFGSVPNMISQGGNNFPSIETPQPNESFGAGSAFNGVHSFAADRAGRASNPFEPAAAAAATVSQPFFTTATTRGEDIELQPSAPPKPFTFTGLKAPAKSTGEAPMQSSEQTFLSGNIFLTFNNQTSSNAINNNAGTSVLAAWGKNDATAANNNLFGFYKQSAVPEGLRMDGASTSAAAISVELKPNEAGGPADEAPRNSEAAIAPGLNLNRAVVLPSDDTISLDTLDDEDEDDDDDLDWDNAADNAGNGNVGNNNDDHNQGIEENAHHDQGIEEIGGLHTRFLYRRQKRQHPCEIPRYTKRTMSKRSEYTELL